MQTNILSPCHKKSPTVSLQGPHLLRPGVDAAGSEGDALRGDAPAILVAPGWATGDVEG